jgi:GMP synthase (glutamine-hydrolysing)
VPDAPRFLLLQVRDADDPMREHEVSCFRRALAGEAGQIRIFDLLSGAPSWRDLEDVDVVLLGGSGNYSVARGGPWLPAALEAMVGLYESGKPTFASCWGFQAMARALGGEVVTDHSRAEVGTIRLELTEAGVRDAVFSPLGKTFLAQSGHEDVVTALPPGATLLARSERVENQAFRIEGKPIYGTQFHPELAAADLVARMGRYPSYLRLIGARDVEELARITPDTPEAEALLGRFLDHVLAAR